MGDLLSTHGHRRQRTSLEKPLLFITMKFLNVTPRSMRRTISLQDDQFPYRGGRFHEVWGAFVGCKLE